MSIILIVDDNRIKREALATVLADEGHIILHAGDGKAGLLLVHAEKPDLVITDMIMPVMDGYDFCKGLRADPDIAETPVVVNSVMDDEKVRLLIQDCDVRFFIPIVAKKSEILEIVTTALRKGPHPTRAQLEAITERLDDVLTELKTLAAKLTDGLG